MYFLDLFGIGNAVEVAFRKLMCGLAAVIYNTIIWVYDIFTALSTARFLENDLVNSIFNKVGLLLGLFMIFKLMFSLIQSLIDPNKFSDKKNGFGSILFRSVISIVLLGIVRTIFDEAFQIQSLLVDDSTNVIYKLIIGENATTTTSSDEKVPPGRQIACDLFFAFYRDDYRPIGLDDYDPEDGYADPNGLEIKDMKEQILSGEKDFHFATKYVGYKDTAENQNEKEFIIEFHWLYSIAFGVLILWILITYCIQVAIRVFQLFFLELIAPIPILSYISDPDGSFKKWLKQCATTYLDLFIRLAIIYFIIYLAPKITSFIDGSPDLIGINWGTLELIPKALGVGLLLIGLLLLGKRIPDLLKDIFPNMAGGVASLNFGISPKKLGEQLTSTPIIGKTMGWTGKQINKGAKSLEKKVTKPITNRYNNWKEDRKNAIEVREQERAGEKIFDKVGPKDLANAFDNDDYRNSYMELDAANKEQREAQKMYDLAVAERKSDEEIEAALEAKNAADKRTKDAQKWHDNNRKRYGSDARKEDAYKLYKSLHPDKFPTDKVASKTNQEAPKNNIIPPVYDRVNQVAGVSRRPASENGAPTAENSLMAQLAAQSDQERMQQEFSNRTVNQNNNQPSQPSIVVEEHAPSSRRQEPPEVQSQNANSEYESLVQQYNNAPKGSKERDEIGRKLSDFEKKH